MKRIHIIAVFFVIFSCSDSNTDIEKDISTEKNIAQNDSTSSVITYTCDYLGEYRPKNTAKLFSPNFISTNVEHSAVMITPDGKEMWFGRLYPPMLWYVEKKNGKWSKIKMAPLDKKYHYLYPFLSPGGNRLYFTSDRPVNPGEERKLLAVGLAQS